MIIFSHSVINHQEVLLFHEDTKCVLGFEEERLHDVWAFEVFKFIFHHINHIVDFFFHIVADVLSAILVRTWKLPIKFDIIFNNSLKERSISPINNWSFDMLTTEFILVRFVWILSTDFTHVLMSKRIYSARHWTNK